MSTVPFLHALTLSVRWCANLAPAAREDRNGVRACDKGKEEERCAEGENMIEREVWLVI